MFKLKFRFNHFLQTKILKKKPIKGKVFIKFPTQKRIIHLGWSEAESLYEKRISFKSLVETACNPLELRYNDISAGWVEIVYGS